MSSEAATLSGTDSMGGRIAILLALILCCSISYAKEIPLSEIWAFEMPGTKDIDELHKQWRPEDIARLQRNPAPKEKSARPTFAVQGTGFEALRNSYEVLAQKKDPNRSFDTNTEISIVFFSITDNWYVHLQSVELKNKTITLNCNMVTHETQETTRHFALIPTGKLPSGKYQVDVVVSQVDTTGQPIPYPLDKEIVNRIISGSSTFSIKEKE
jgi:hypothetical protein